MISVLFRCVDKLQAGTALQFAAQLASQGYRTLVVDLIGDSPRPFTPEKQPGGFRECFVSRFPNLSEVFTTTEQENLFFSEGQLEPIVEQQVGFLAGNLVAFDVDVVLLAVPVGVPGLLETALIMATDWAVGADEAPSIEALQRHMALVT